MNQMTKQDGLSYKSVAIAPHGGGGMLLPQTFGDVVSFSEIMARSQHAIPKHLRDVPGACMAVTMQALRWEMDPFLVASKSYNVKDLIAYEAQLIAAVVHTRAPITTRPNYVYSGEAQDRRCAVSATFDDGQVRTYESPRIGDITTKNSPLWKADPDQQLGYYSIRAFARRYCPEVILGVYTPEEAETFQGPDHARDVTPRRSLSERLTGATEPAPEGFSRGHVERETNEGPGVAGPGETSSGPQAEPDSPNPSVSSEQHLLPVAEAQAEAAPVDDHPAPSTGEPSETSVSGPGADQGDGGGDQGAPSPSLPQGWEITYAAALRRAQRKESLPKLARDFWKQYGGWASITGSDRETGVAIYTAFEKNFGNKDAIEADLRELI